MRGKRKKTRERLARSRIFEDCEKNGANSIIILIPTAAARDHFGVLERPCFGPCAPLHPPLGLPSSRRAFLVNARFGACVNCKRTMALENDDGCSNRHQEQYQGGSDENAKPEYNNIDRCLYEAVNNPQDNV